MSTSTMNFRVTTDWSDWLRAGGASPATVKLRAATIGALLNHVGAGASVLTVTSMDIARWLGSQKAPWTRATYRSGACAFFTWMHLTGQRDDNPTTLIPKQRKPRAVPDPVDKAVLRKMLTEPLGGRSLAYTTLAAYAGLRVAEIAAMHASVVEGEWLRVTGKGGHTSMIPMHDRIARISKAHPRGYWFPGKLDGHVHPNSVSQTLKSAMIAAGAPSDAHAHQIRHAFGTELMRATGDLRLTSELMRHASLQSTAGYTYVADDRRRDAIRRLRLAG